MENGLSDKSLIKIGQAAKALGVSIKTLRRWEASGKLTPIRTPGGTRFYSAEELYKFNSKTKKAQPPQTPLELMRIPNHLDSPPVANFKPRRLLPSTSAFTEQKHAPRLIFSIRAYKAAVAFLVIPLFIIASVSLLPAETEVQNPENQKQILGVSIQPPGLSSFLSSASTILQQLAQSLGITASNNSVDLPTNSPSFASSTSGSVLASEITGRSLEINASTAIKGALTVDKEINGLTLNLANDGISIQDTEASNVLTVSGNIVLNQSLTETSSPTFSSLNLSETKNQMVFGGAGTLTWTPTSARTLTLPDITDTLVGKTTTDTLSNKTIKSGDSNTISGSFTGITGLGTVTAGTWNATAITTGYGGTGLTSYTTGDILYASAADTLAKLSIGTSGKILIAKGGVPAWDSTLFVNYTNGNVGIGTTQPAEVLDVNGRINLAQTTAPSTTTDKLYNVSGTLYWNGTNISGSGVGTLPTGTLAGQTLYFTGSTWATTNTLFSDNTNVGIGTTSPSYKLDVLSASASQFRLGYDTSNYLTLAVSSAGAVTLDATGGSAGFTLRDPLTLGIAGSSNGSVTFNSSGATETAPTIAADADGNLAIAATSGLVDIGSGTGNITLDPGASNLIANLTGTGDFLIQDNGISYAIFDDTGSIGIGTTTPGGKLVVMGGNVGIGTTSPSAPFEVKGSGTGVVIAKFTDTNTTGCTLADGGTISCSSDLSLKKNISDIDYGLDSLMKLHPVSFNWKNQADETAKNLGFVAQEVEEIIPKLILTDLETGLKELNAIGLIPVLTRSIQEQQGQLDGIKGNVLSIMGNLPPPIPTPTPTPGPELATQSSLFDLKSEVASLSARLSKLEASPSAQANTPGVSLGSPGVSTPSASLEDLVAQAATSSTTTFSSLEVSESLKTMDATISGTLKSLGNTFLGNTLVAGDFSVDGTLSLTGNSINSLAPCNTPEVGLLAPSGAEGDSSGVRCSGTLYIQNSPLSTLVDFFNGKVTIDKTGAVVLEKLVVSDKSIDNLLDPTIGSGVMPSDKTSVTIHNNQVTSSSKIFVTPRNKIGKQSLVVDSVIPKASFTVSLDTSLSQDVKFDWWIVETQ